MVKTDKKYNAFSLIETMVSMIVIMVIALAMLPVLTKARPKIETVTVRGQYACWYNGSQLQQQYADERSVKPVQNVSACTFDLDKRPAQYLIMASGAGNNGSQGQFVTKYTPSINSALPIVIGRTSGNGITTVGDSTTGGGIVAGGGYALSTNNLIASNIKSCKLLSTGSACSTTGQKQESCEVVVANGAPIIRVNCCDILGSGCTNQTADLVSIATLTKSGTSYNSAAYTMALELYDSSYMAKSNSTSKMSQLIDHISEKRKSALTQTIRNLNAGAGGNNGAVLIIW